MIGATVWPSSCKRRLEVCKKSHHQLIKCSSKASVVYNTNASQAKSIELFHVQQRTQRLRPPQTAESEAMNSAANVALMESMPRRSEINLTLVSCINEIGCRIQVTFTILPQKATRWGSEQLKSSPPTILSAIFTTATGPAGIWLREGTVY